MFLHQMAETVCHLLQVFYASNLKLLGRRNVNSLTSASTQHELKRLFREADLCLNSLLSFRKHTSGTVQKRANTGGLKILSIERPSYKVGPWLESANLNFRRFPSFPGKNGSLSPNGL